MKKNILHFIKITLALVLFLQVGQVSAQNNLTIKSYATDPGTFNIDGTALDQVFGTVTFNGATITSPTFLANSMTTTLPTTVAGFGGVQMVLVGAFNGSMSYAQADALIAYVKGGGILVANLEGAIITSTSIYADKYIAEALLCNSVTLTGYASGTFTGTTSPAYHPGNGALLLNTSGAGSFTTTGSLSAVKGLPSENVIYAISASAACNAVYAVDYVIPAYPGSISSCGVNGFALFSTECRGILDTTYRGTGMQSNKNYAQLIFDFLYSPSAMNTRRAWSTINTNKNTTCPPALSPAVCASGLVPTLSATTINNSTCASGYINLNSLVTSTTPTGATLKWYADNTRTTEVIDPTGVITSGTYYAFYYDATNNCYSPASAAVTATYTVCPLNISTVCPAVSVDLASRVTGAAPSGFEYTYHSATPATTANKLTSSVVATSGTYYVATYFAGQDCYTTTSRPIVVTITNCCATLAAPTWN